MTDAGAIRADPGSAPAGEPSREPSPAGEPPAVAAPEPAPSPRSGPGLGALAVFALSFLLVFGGAVIATDPVRRERLRALLGVGSRPLAPAFAVEGLLLEVRPGARSGLELVYRNLGPIARDLQFPDPARGGVELDVIVEDAREVALPQAPEPFTPETPGLEGTARRITLEPGASHTQTLDLERFVPLPGPGRYRVRVERACLAPGEPRLRSNELWVEKR